MDTVYLVGTEDIRQAGISMQQAAYEISRAAGNLDEILGRHLCALEALVERVEAACVPREG